MSFTINNFIADMDLLDKHPEIFKSNKPKQVKIFLNYFIKYTKFINSCKKDHINSLIKMINKDFNKSIVVADKLQLSTWSEKFFKFAVTNDIDNDVYVLPKNDGSEKFILNQKYDTNAIKLNDVDVNSLKVVNRNNHMMIAGNSKNLDLALGKELSFKMIIIYNNKLKKWLVSPYKMLSVSATDMSTSTFALVATTDIVDRQYKLWERGLTEYKDKIGILNLKYFDKSFENLPNLFGKNSDKLLKGAIDICKNANKGGSSKKLTMKKLTVKKLIGGSLKKLTSKKLIGGSLKKLTVKKLTSKKLIGGSLKKLTVKKSMSKKK